MHEDAERPVHAAAKIRDQHLDADLRITGTDRFDAACKVCRTPVAQVVTIHRGDHDITQSHFLDSAAQIFRFIRIERFRPAMCHVTERAAARADIAHDHEGGCAAGKALADVRAGGLLANSMQAVFTQDLLESAYCRIGR